MVLRIGIRLDHRHSIELIASSIQFRKEACNDFRRVRNDSQATGQPRIRVAAINHHLQITFFGAQIAPLDVPQSGLIQP
jgi:hypothetical protein